MCIITLCLPVPQSVGKPAAKDGTTILRLFFDSDLWSEFVNERDQIDGGCLREDTCWFKLFKKFSSFGRSKTHASSFGRSKMAQV